MEEVFTCFDGADRETLAIFDVDMVLLQPSAPAFQMANIKRFSATCKRIMREIPQDKQMLFLSLMTTKYGAVLLDDRLPEFLAHMTQRGIPAMALTASLTGGFGSIQKMENWRVECLRQLGIDFSRSMIHQTPIVFDELASYRGNHCLYVDGVLFVNGNVVSKGEALVAFLKKTELWPSSIIFVDDREENLKSVETALQTIEKPIKYQGVHYTGAQRYPSKPISEEEFEAQWHQLASEAKALPV